MSMNVAAAGTGSEMSVRHRGCGARPTADALFASIDGAKQGKFDKATLAAAVEKASGSAGAKSAPDVDALFGALDANDDGQVTKAEFGDALAKLSEQLQSHADGMRMRGPDGGGMAAPPPPPRADTDSGLTKDELSAVLESVKSDSTRGSDFLASVIESFDKVDTDGNGKVTRQEADVLRREIGETGAPAQRAGPHASGGRGTHAGDDRFEIQLRQLVDAYGVLTGTQAAPGSELSTTG